MKRLFAILSMAAFGAYGANITEVKVNVLDKFGGDVSSVLSRCQTKVGNEYDPVMLTSDVNELNKSGLFDNIKADAVRDEDGVKVTFSVFRKMRFIAPLIVEGNSNIGVSKIIEESGLKDGKLYGEGDLAVAAAKVRNYYIKKHYPDAKVIPVTKLLPGGNSCMVTFMVDEGVYAKASNYVFPGAASVDHADLRAKIGVRPFWDFRGWFADKPVTQEELAQAADKIVEHYTELGYLDVKVKPAQIINNEVVFEVVEGPLYKIGSIDIKGVKSYAVKDVAKMSDLPAEGDVAGSKVLSDAAHRISVAMGSGDLGLAETRVDVVRIPRENDATVLDIVFNVTEGAPVVVEKVSVVGNEYTKDNVIRREIELDPGDNMLADRAENSKKRLEALYYFSRVRYYLRDTGHGKNDQGAAYRELVYEVEERNTGNFSFGLGAGSVDSVYVHGEVQQSNLDIFAPEKMFRGAGQKGRLFAQVGPRIQTYEAEISEPWFMARALELRVQAYRRQRWYDEYDVIRTGGSVSIDYPVLVWMPWKGKGLSHKEPFGRFGIGIVGEFIELDEMERGYYDFGGKKVSLAEKGGEDDLYGDAFEGVLRLYWARNQLDDYRMPTSGSRTRLSLDLAGGDNEYWRLALRHRNYFNVWEKYSHVLMLAARVETIDAFNGEVPIYNRMFLGGPKSIRGIEYRHVSPMAKRQSDGKYVPWGGQSLFCINAEYTIPIVKMFRVAFFSDAGAVGVDEFDFDVSDNFAWTAGIGFRIDIPSFPIRIDFAAPIEKPDEAEKEVFSFTIGYDF